MNRLNPELKRLMSWSSRAPSAGQDLAPFGFGGRVVARKMPGRGVTFVSELQQIAWSTACVAVVVILCGVVVLASQAQTPAAAADLSSALQFLASNLHQ